ncbi:hypothetical protein Tco_0090285, partial [Tanacetum coccineum]
DDSLVRAATTASSLEAEQDSGGGPRRQESIRDTNSQTRFENVSKLSHDLLLVRGNTLRSGEDSLKLKELMELCTNLQTRVLDLETTKTTTQANEIASLKRGTLPTGYYQIDEMPGCMHVDTLTSDEVLAEQVVAAKDGNLSVDEVTLAQALKALKSAKVQKKWDVIKEPSVPVSTVTASTKDSTVQQQLLYKFSNNQEGRKGIVFQEPGTTTTKTTTIFSQQPSQANVQDKGKGKMVEPEKPMKRKELIRLDEEIASKLQAEFNEEVRLAREKAKKEQEANVALAKEWDDIQAKIEADHELAQRLQAQEQEELFDADKATLFVQLLEKRRKHFAAKRAEEKRNKPPTQAQ